MRNSWQDVRYAMRGLLKAPVFALVVIVTLALGTGANSAIFSVVDTVLLRPLPYPAAGRLVMAFETSPSDVAAKLPSAVADVADWQEQNHVFEQIAAEHPWSFTITGQGDPERVPGGVVSANLFAVLGRRPLLGRDFRPEEQGPNAEPVAILGYGLWQRRFGADPGVLGSKLTLDDKPYTVVGVMPADFEFPDLAELWRPLTHGRDLEHRDFQFLRVVARLRPAVTLARAQREMSAIADRLARQFPPTNAGRGVLLVPLREQLAGELRPALLVLMGTVVLILAIACTNLINLMFARAAARRGELAVRSALGASRARLVAQQTIESLLLATAGGGLGLLLAHSALRALAALPGDLLPRFAHPEIDGRVLVFTLVLSTLAGLVVGILPALQASRPQLGELLKAAAGRQRGGTASARGSLVAIEVGMALMLLVGAGLLVQSFARLRSVPPGFDTADFLTLQLSLPEGRYPGLPQTDAFRAQLLERLARLPGVTSATAALALPLLPKTMSVDVNFKIDGEAPAAPDDKKVAFLRPVAPNYFRVMGVPVRSGRAFAPGDDARAAPVAIINQELARRYWPRGNALGRHLTVGSDLGDLGNAPEVSREIIGIAGDVKHTGLGAPPLPEIYVSMAQTTWRLLLLVVRSAQPPEALTRPVAREIWALDKSLPLYRVRTLHRILADSTAKPALYSALLATFAGLALLLAAIGIYGLISYAVSERRREIGIRMALGARQRDVINLMVGWVLALTLAGTAAGIAASLALSRLLASLMFGISARDTVTLLGAAALLTAVALLASYLPARRAARIDPVAALHVE